jgi:hypothetical protein
LKPSIGRIVHFVLENEQHRPAFITRVHENGLVNLSVIFDGSNDPVSETSQPWRSNVGQNVPTKTANYYAKWTWHWPEPVEE